MYYILNSVNNTIYGEYSLLKNATAILSNLGTDYFIAETTNMNIISRIVRMDDSVIYNNVEFWTNASPELFTEHKFYDILGQEVSYDRFRSELTSNINRIHKIDGRPGQIEYNMVVGNEFVSLFREECILTKFTKESDTSPMIIFEKLTPVIAMLDAADAIEYATEEDYFYTAPETEA